MSPRRHSADRRGRRHDLGIGVRDMAVGLGIRRGRLLSMEDGTATDEDKTFYRTWLSRIEGWSSSQRRGKVGPAVVSRIAFPFPPSDSSFCRATVSRRCRSVNVVATGAALPRFAPAKARSGRLLGTDPIAGRAFLC